MAVTLSRAVKNAFHALAILSFQTGDLAGYQHWRGEILQRFATQTNASGMVNDCLLVAPSPAEAKTIGKMIDLLVASGGIWDAHLRYSIKGWFEYRQGHFLKKIIAAASELIVLKIIFQDSQRFFTFLV